MQAKISTFFKPTTTGNHGSTSPPPNIIEAEEERQQQQSTNNEEDVLVTYGRRSSNTPIVESVDSKCLNLGIDSKRLRPVSGVVKNKRKYAQYHLELGQSDFLLHHCDICGLSYARGDEEDEKVHNAFHKNYHQGVQFKGWCNERVISMLGSENNKERIILVLDSDPPNKKHKVQEVAKLMSKDLCSTEEWIVHRLCKTYLFISRKRIVGCLVTEHIKEAYRIIPKSDSSNHLKSTHIESSKSKRTSSVLPFGDITFQRETIKRCSSGSGERDMCDSGAIFCEEEAVPASFGVRAIWVAPSQRRNRVATRLLDAARKEFWRSTGLVPSECAFSAPTSAGRSFAASYSRTGSFLVYKPYECIL